jgi:radical SAM protein (TIGR01212 family)
MKYPWGHHRRFNAASNYMKKLFGMRVQKLTIDAGFTCPNRDGTKSTGGCTYCNNQAFNPSYCNPNKTVTQQLLEGIEFHEKRYRSAQKYLAYFQAYSNTYGNIHHLENLYREALKNENVIGLIIGTRPDCVDDAIFDLLEDISKTHYLSVEFGIESIYDQTLEKINRGHTFNESVVAIQECAKRKIFSGAHIIFGLPGETEEMMMNSAAVLSELPLNNIKFHQLQIIKNTTMADEYLHSPKNFTIFSIESYIEFITGYLSVFSPDIVIERLASETQPWQNIEPGWNIRYDQVLKLIEKKLEEKDIWQGKSYNV